MSSRAVPIPQGFTLGKPAAPAEPEAQMQQPTQDSPKAVPVPAGFSVGKPPAPKPEDKGIIQGIANVTVKPVADAAQAAHAEVEGKDWTERAKVGLKKGITTNPIVQAGQGVSNIAHEQAEQGSKAWESGKRAVVGGIASAKALLRGDWKEARFHGERAGEEVQRATGHGLAAAVPLFGPMAANAAEKIGDGRVREGIGEAIGTVGQVVAPGLVSKGAKKVLPKIAEGPKAVDVPNAKTKIPVRGETSELKLKLADGDKLNEMAGKTEAAVKSATGEIASDAVKAPVSNFAEAGEVSISRAKRTYQKLDHYSKNEFSKLQQQARDLKKQLKAGNNVTEAREALDEVKLKMSQMAEESGVGEKALAEANTTYSRGLAQKKLHAAFYQSSKGVPADAQGALGGYTSTAETLDGAALLRRLRQLDRKGVIDEAVSNNRTHRASIIELADLLANEKQIPRISSIAETVMQGGGIGAVLGGYGKHALVGLTAKAGAAKLLARIITDPDAVAVLSYGLKKRISTGVIATQLTRVLVQNEKTQEAKGE
jgi:hypothetical protein